MFQFYNIMKYVRCEFDYRVDTQLCKLHNMSRLNPIFTEFPNFMIKPFARIHVCESLSHTTSSDRADVTRHELCRDTTAPHVSSPSKNIIIQTCLALLRTAPTVHKSEYIHIITAQGPAPKRWIAVPKQTQLFMHIHEHQLQINILSQDSVRCCTKNKNLTLRGVLSVENSGIYLAKIHGRAMYVHSKPPVARPSRKHRHRYLVYKPTPWNFRCCSSMYLPGVRTLYEYFGVKRFPFFSARHL